MAEPLIYFSRHGETDWNVSMRLQGQVDTDINALGRSQADANGLKLKALVPDPAGFDFVASPLRRTRETMERIRRAMELPPQDYRTDERLMELNFGEWQGFTYAELEARNPGMTKPRSRDKWNFTPPGGESYAALTARVADWLASVGRPTICVAHGGVIRALFRMVGMSEREASRMHVPQDRILRRQDGRLDWI